MDTLLTNKTLIAAFIAFVLAQFLKIVINLLLNKELNIKSGFDTGGMPSSHTATVSAVKVYSLEVKL